MFSNNNAFIERSQISQDYKKALVVSTVEKVRIKKLRLQ